MRDYVRGLLGRATRKNGWQTGMGRGVRSSPTVAGNVVYISRDDGFPRALDTTSGQIRWRLKTHSGLWSSPVVADDLLYVGSSDRPGACRPSGLTW